MCPSADAVGAVVGARVEEGDSLCFSWMFHGSCVCRSMMELVCSVDEELRSLEKCTDDVIRFKLRYGHG